MDVKLKSVERDGAGLFNNIEINDDGSVKSQFFEIGFEGDMVVAWDDICGKQFTALGATGSGTTTRLVYTSLSTTHVV